MHISVCICSYKRPEMLRKLLGELRRLETGDRFTFSVVISDNDPEESGRVVVEDVLSGYPVRIEETKLSYADYAAELARNADSIAAFKHTQQSAFEAERQRWKDEGLDSFIADEGASASDASEIPSGHFGVATSVPGNIWKILVEETYSIGTVGLSPAVMGVRIVKNNIGNVPSRQMNAMHCRTPCSSHPTTLFFKS